MSFYFEAQPEFLFLSSIVLLSFINCLLYCISFTDDVKTALFDVPTTISVDGIMVIPEFTEHVVDLEFLVQSAMEGRMHNMLGVRTITSGPVSQDDVIQVKISYIFIFSKI